MKSIRKMVSIVLSLIMIFSVFAIVPLTASAAAETWAGLQNEIKNTSSGTISLSRDITADDSDTGITIDSGRNITLDLCGHTLSRDLWQTAQSGFVIKVESGATLTVKDSGGKNEGKITGGHSDNGGGIVNEGTLRVEGIPE